MTRRPCPLSAAQIRAVARVADSGLGVLPGYGNYARDVLHSGQTTEMLQAEKIDARGRRGRAHARPGARRRGTR